MRKFFLIILLFLSLGVGCNEKKNSSYISNKSTSNESCYSLEPSNPYNIGSGHYAGFEWAESKQPTVCGGNSNSFIEGCEEYLRQEEDYNKCLL